MKTRRGLEITTSDEQVAVQIDEFSDRLLRIAPGSEEILNATAESPDEPALQLASALFWLFGQTPDAQKKAEDALLLVRMDALCAREVQWVQILSRWHARDFAIAADLLEDLTEKWPEDLVAAKSAEFLYYVLGQQHSGPRFRVHMDRLRGCHSKDPDYLAMDAFAHELCGDANKARQSAEQALEIQPRTPWAQHALEHVLLWEGNSEEAIRQMEGWVGDWEASARPIHSHNAWHLALAYLDRIECDDAFRIFEQHVWMQTPEMVVEQLDSIAFLWRAEMAGVEVPVSRWLELTPKILEVSQTLFMPFATAHYVYALGRAGETEAVEMVLDLAAQRAKADDAEATRVWAPTGLPVVRAAAAVGQGDAVTAAKFFDVAMPRLTEIGGSDAQDDLFRFGYLDCLLRSGRNADALNFLKNRLANKTPSPLEASLLERL